MERAEQDLDCKVRRLIRAVEPDLRHHLAIERLDRELVSDLYWRLRTVLESARRPSSEALTPERLALVVFMVLVARPNGAEISPALLVSLRRTLARATGESQAPAGRSESGGSR